MEMTLGKRIAAGRKMAGLTQDKLAEQLGVTAQAVSKWENDQSCPDVTMLPKLAEIFGTTTDALLGMEQEEPVFEAQVVSDEEDEGFHYQNDHVNIHVDGGRRGSLGFALWVLVFGGLLLASSLLLWDVSWWSLCWQSGLLVLGLVELLHKFSFPSLGCAILGGYFLAGNFLHLTFSKGLVVPVLIVLLGLCLLVEALRKPRKTHFGIHTNGRIDRSAYSCEGEHFACSTSFGEDTRRIDLARLSSGEAQVSFGELTVDLTDCGQIAPDAQVNLNCSFGELNLRVPRSCRVEYTDKSSFASVEVKGRPRDDAPDRLFVDCSVSFGEIEISYI